MEPPVQTDQTWSTVLKEEKEKPYFKEILKFVAQERSRSKIIYPTQNNVFNAFKYTPFASVKAVILGQDPYHGINQAHGLSFSVCPNTPLPPSLRNIFKELSDDLQISPSSQGYLKKWAEQGVLLLNSILTVEAKKPQSHAHLGWQRFTDTVISMLNQYNTSIVFLLWGSYAQQKKILITNPNHLVLKAPHPSPLSAHRGFLGCQHFSKTNAYLISRGRDPIDWSL